MNSLNRITAGFLAAGLALTGVDAFATNGYFTHGVGTQSKGMAGTGVGSNADMGSIMSVSNPALGVFSGDDWEFGVSLFSPRRNYQAGPSQLNGAPIDLGNGSLLPSFTITPGKIDSSSEFFPIPYIAKSWDLESDAKITAAFYGRGGMNTDWDDGRASATSYFCGGNPFAGEPPATGPGPYCAGDAGVDLIQAFLAINYSAKVNERFAWGGGPVFGIQSFEAKGIATFTPITEACVNGFNPMTGQCGTFPGSLTDNGHETSFGVGFAAGFWWGISDRVSLGVAYQSKISMSDFDDYSDLYAENGGFDIPSSVKGGLSFTASETLRINFDVEHSAFGEIDSVGNPMANMLACPGLPFGGTDLESCLGGDRGPGFGWEDMTTYKIGFEWIADRQNTWRFGYSRGDQPVQAADILFNILAPGVIEEHFTLGLTHERPNGSAWSFSLMYAPEFTVSGPSMFDPTQTLEVSMKQYEFEIGYRF